VNEIAIINALSPAISSSVVIIIDNWRQTNKTNLLTNYKYNQ